MQINTNTIWTMSRQTCWEGKSFYAVFCTDTNHPCHLNNFQYKLLRKDRPQGIIGKYLFYKSGTKVWSLILIRWLHYLNLMSLISLLHIMWLIINIYTFSMPLCFWITVLKSFLVTTCLYLAEAENKTSGSYFHL